MAEILFDKEGRPRPCMCRRCRWERTSHEMAENAVMDARFEEHYPMAKDPYAPTPEPERKTKG